MIGLNRQRMGVNEKRQSANTKTAGMRAPHESLTHESPKSKGLLSAQSFIVVPAKVMRMGRLSQNRTRGPGYPTNRLLQTSKRTSQGPAASQTRKKGEQESEQEEQDRGQEGGQEGLEDTGSGREKRKGQVKDAMQSCLIYNDFQRRSKMQTIAA